jgi:hypothetical protein
MTYTISLDGTSWYISGIDKKQLNRTLDALFEKGYSPINPNSPKIIITKHESEEK